MINSLLNNKSKTITSAALILAMSSFLSRLLGLLRDRMLAGTFGAGRELDAYYAAFRVPDFLFNIIIISAIASAFLPIFSRVIKENEEEANKFLSNILNISLTVLFILAVFLIILSPFLINLIAPGFDDAEKKLTVALTRIMFLSPIFLGISSIISGVLHYFSRFLIYSLAPIFYNLGVIFGIFFLVPRFGIYGVAIGVVLGAAMHLLIQLAALFTDGFKWRKVFNIKDKNFLDIIQLSLPRSLSLIASQANSWIITVIASLLPVGSIAIFNFASNIHYMPVGIIGISVAIAAYPLLSQASAASEKDKFISNFSFSLRMVLFAIVPLAISFIVLRAQIVRLALGAGNFDWEATRLTAASLGLFSFSVIAQSLIPIFSRVFFSLEDTKTPTIINIFSVILNIALSFFILKWFAADLNFQYILGNILKIQDLKNSEVIILPLAFSVSGIFNLAFLAYFLFKKIGDYDVLNILKSLSQIMLSSIAAGASMYLALYFSSVYVNMEKFSGIFTQTAIAAISGMLVYFVSIVLLGNKEWEYLALPLKINELAARFKNFSKNLIDFIVGKDGI